MRRSAEYGLAQREGVRVRARHFVLVVVSQARPSAPRLGLIVSKKCGNAIARNRIKRLVRECFRTSELVPDGVDLIVIGLEGAHELTLGDVRREWSDVQPALARAARKALAPSAAKAHVTRAAKT